MSEFPSEKVIGTFKIRRRTAELTTVYNGANLICAYMHPWNGNPATPYIYGVTENMKGESWDRWLERVEERWGEITRKAIIEGVAP